MILCDTNVLIEFYKGNDVVREALSNIGLPNLGVSIITIGELYYGAKDKHELTKLQKHLGLLHQFQLDAETSEIFLEIMSKFVLSHKLSVPDGLIAATAIRHAIPLYTFNLKDFHYLPRITLHKI